MNTEMDQVRRTGSSHRDGREGAVLGMAMIIVLLVGILAWGLLRVGEFNAVEVGKSVIAEQAFWAAEAGVQHAKAKLWKDQSFRSDPSLYPPLTGVNPAYSVTTTKDGSDPHANPYTIRSTGVVASATQVVWQCVFAGEVRQAAFNYALFGGAGEMYISKNASIDGQVFQNGPVTFKTTAAIVNGNINYPSEYTNSITVPRGFTNLVVSDPVPRFPAFDPGPAGAGYSDLIRWASLYGDTAPITNSINVSGTNWLRQNLTLTNDIIATNVVLIVSGGVSIDASVRFTNNVHIISGGRLDLNCSTCFAETNCLIYAATSIESTKAGGNVTIGTVTLITTGGVGEVSGGLNKSLIVTGAIYAAGAIVSKKDLTVTGSVLAGGGVNIAKNFSVTYADLWANGGFMTGFTPEVTVTNILWRQEL